MRVRLDAQPVPPDLLEGLRDAVDARIRPGLDKKTSTARAVHTIYNLVELLVLRLPHQFLLVQGAGAAMGAELRTHEREPYDQKSGQHGSAATLAIFGSIIDPRACNGSFRAARSARQGQNFGYPGLLASVLLPLALQLGKK